MKLFPVLLVLIFLFSGEKLFAQSELPLGSHPPALQFDHFPNRLFAFVWRNWNLVSPEKMGKTLGCKPEEILEIASTMGLDKVEVLSNHYQKQIYITLLRRNWHLLPYEQLLTLVDMEVEELEFALKEDDFLFYKFGNLKPDCPILTYTPPNKQDLEKVPELGGVFTITASENLTNCASHGGKDACPRCSKRPYAEILAEVNQVIADGVHRSQPAAKVIAWDWGWHGHGDARDVIEKLPEDVWLMSVSEWGKQLERGGISTIVNEYSISAVGPGPRAQNHWEAAKNRGLKTVAKVQFNNTWELSALPWLPVMDLVAQHAVNLAQTDIDGYMLSWTLGAYPSPNLEIARKFTENPNASVEEVLNELALERYGAEAKPAIRKAWTAFSAAFQEYPYHQKVVYSAPQQYGPSNLLFLQSTGYKATMVGFPYDDLQGWSGPFPPQVLARQFAKVANGWEIGLKLMEEALAASSSGEFKNQMTSDLLLARAAYLHFLSVAQQAKFILLRDKLKAKPSNAPFIRKQMRALVEQEIQTALDLYGISRRDSRVGFEASNQYYYVPQDLMEKVINCEFLLRQLTD